MTLFKTNAEGLDELDIALAELRALSLGDAPPSVDDSLTSYNGGGELVSVPDNLDQTVDRVAMCDEFNFLRQGWRPTRWKQIRDGRYDTTYEHSTHNLYPFVGKLEPRIARACVNLAVGCRYTATVVDPFCGSGTILLEANLMGFNTIGGDVDPFAYWLTMMKLSLDADEYDQVVRKLNPAFARHGTVFAKQREACPPKAIGGHLDPKPAVTVLESIDHQVQAIVTSPPYYDAINYNERHAEIRKRLDLSPPNEQTMGIDQTVFDYAQSIGQVAKSMVGCLSSSGRIVIVAASYHGVDTTALYEESLALRGMKKLYRLKRPYRSPSLGIQADDILVMEKP